MLISMDDLITDNGSISMLKSTEANESDNDNENDEEDQDVKVAENNNKLHTIKRWADHSFVKPHRALQELSGFSSLNVMYKILVSLAITSSSAERAMSRVRLIKNHLPTTMLDDWFSSLMILASEKDILENIPVDSIIDHFSTLSPLLQKLLIN